MNNHHDYLNDINILKTIIEDKYNNNNIFTFKESYHLYNSLNNIENFLKSVINLHNTNNKDVPIINFNNINQDININNVEKNVQNNNVEENVEENKEELSNIVNTNIIEREIKNIILENITNTQIEELFYNNLNI